MAGMHPRRRPAVRPLLQIAVVLSLLMGSTALGGAPAVAVEAVPAWTGSISLYRDGVFTTQQSWLWCTAADVQIARNLVYGEREHAASVQRRYFDWMRTHHRYDLPRSAGVDPDGWTAGMRQFVDDRYRLVASDTFDSALKLAVQHLRRTGLPVALAVSHGNHGWLLTGFAATADPLATDDFEPTSVRVVGPLYGLQSKDGYDMRPNTQLSTAQLRRYFTAWWYGPMRMTWEGPYVSIQPVPEDLPRPEAALPSGPVASFTPPSAAESPIASLLGSPIFSELAMPSNSPMPVAIDNAARSATSTTRASSSSTDAGGPPLLLGIVVAVSALVATLMARTARRREG